MVFDYPDHPHRRKHGPAGYKNYEQYRPWLRDEFCFRCVYCMRREQWGLFVGNWDIDHFQPKSVAPKKALDYDNLLYSCHTCNLNKSDDSLCNPCEIALGELVEVNAAGVIKALTDEGEIFIRALNLDNADYTNFRRKWLRDLSIAKQHAPDLFAEYMGYPDNLPSLEKLKPPDGNSRPTGVENSYLAQRTKDELPETY